MILRSVVFSILLLVGSFTTSELRAQIAVQAKDADAIQKTFDSSIEDLRESVKAIRAAQLRHYFADSELSYDFREKWEKEVAKGDEIYAQVRKNAMEVFDNTENPGPHLLEIVRNLNAKSYEDGHIENCYRVTKRLLELIPNDPNLKTDMARISISANDFAAAQKYGLPSMIEKFSPIEKILFEQIEMLKYNWAEELKMRAKSAEAEEPLPLVELEVKDKGKIIIELFEDEAPETVGNFISLADAGFYDNMVFHPVLSHFLVETGSGTLQERRSAGYNIHDENDRPDRRYHLRGAIGMATNLEERDSASSRFYILRVSAPGLDPTNTVFGRVVSGMEIVDSLTNTMKTNLKNEEEVIEGAIPDLIVTAKVTRRRKHGKYEPNKISR